jgi:hypothetical protein
MGQMLFLSLGIRVLKYLQTQDSESDSMQNRMNHLIELQELREEIYYKSHTFQEKMKDIFDKNVKKEHFHTNDLVLKWDARIEDKGKHGKFDHLWKGPYQIASYSGNNAYILKEVNGDFLIFYTDMTIIPSDLKPAVKALRSQGITSLVYKQLKILS